MLWEQYCERQRYTITLEYFIEKYGIEKGTKAFEEFSISRLGSHNNSNGSISKAENNFHLEMKIIFCDVEVQFKIKNIIGYKVYDFFIKDKNIIIEFNGDFWHMNPKTYKPEDIHPIAKYTAQEKWELDKEKQRLAESFGFKVINIWESDWIKNPDEILKYIKRIVDEK